MNNRKPYSLAYKYFYRVPVSVAKVFVHIKPWVLDARKNTYYPERPLKSKFRILMDHLSLAFRHGHFFRDDYFAMGIDQKDKKVADYIAEAENTLALNAKNTSFGLSPKKWHYDMCAILKDKWIFSQLCKCSNLPIPKTYGLLVGSSRNLISDSYDSLECLLKDNIDVMIKPIDGSSGFGIFHLKTQDGHMFVKGQEISIDNLWQRIGKRRYIIQQFVNNQHEDMSRLYPDACNTLRITVSCENDEFRLMGCMCMLGAHGTDCSNWHFGGVSINVREDGTLDKYGYCKLDKKVAAHPDTGVTFEGYKIPFYDEAISLVRCATERFYGLCSIGWDVAITTDGPILIEGNDGWGVVAHQMVENQGWMSKWEQNFGKMNM